MRKVDFILPTSFSRHNTAAFLQKWLEVDGNITYADDLDTALMRANQSNRDVLLAFEENQYRTKTLLASNGRRCLARRFL